MSMGKSMNNKQASCKTCSRRKVCKRAIDVKVLTGCKLSEMWFTCYVKEDKDEYIYVGYAKEDGWQITTKEECNMSLGKYRNESIEKISIKDKKILKMYIKNQDKTIDTLVEAYSDIGDCWYLLDSDWLYNYDENQSYRLVN